MLSTTNWTHVQNLLAMQPRKFPQGPCASLFDKCPLTVSKQNVEWVPALQLSSWTKINYPTVEGRHFKAATKYSSSSRCLRIGKMIPFLYWNKRAFIRAGVQKTEPKTTRPTPDCNSVGGGGLGVNEFIRSMIALHQVKPLVCWASRGIVNVGWFCSKSSTLAKIMTALNIALKDNLIFNPYGSAATRGIFLAQKSCKESNCL